MSESWRSIERLLVELSEWFVQDEEVLHSWLLGLHLDDYHQMFVIAGYDMPTISRMTPEVRTNIIAPVFIRLLQC